MKYYQKHYKMIEYKKTILEGHYARVGKVNNSFHISIHSRFYLLLQSSPLNRWVLSVVIISDCFPIFDS